MVLSTMLSKVRLVSNSDGSLAEVQVDVSGDGSYALKIPATADGTLAVASFSPTVSGLAENNASSAYDGAQEVSFSSLNSGGSYCYTTDGSIPACSNGSCTAGSTGSSLTLERSATVKAVSCVTGFATSDVYSASYVIDAEAPTAPTSVSPSAVESTGSLKSVALNWGNATDDVTRRADLRGMLVNQRNCMCYFFYR